MVGLLRGPAGARSQRPARQPRLGHCPDWPTQPRPEGLCRPVRIFLRPPQGYFVGNSVVFGRNGGAVVVAGRVGVRPRAPNAIFIPSRPCRHSCSCRCPRRFLLACPGVREFGSTP